MVNRIESLLPRTGRFAGRLPYPLPWAERKTKSPLTGARPGWGLQHEEKDYAQ